MFSGILFYLFAISATVQKNHLLKKKKVAGVDHLRRLFSRFIWVIFYQIWLPVCHKYPGTTPGCCNMKESPAGVSRTLLSAYSSKRSDIPVFYFHCCKSNTEKGPSALPTNSQASVLLEVKCSRTLLEGRLHAGIITSSM